MMTIEIFNKIPPGATLRVVFTRFQRVEPRYRGTLIFVATKGFAPEGDWAIYFAPESEGIGFAKTNGDKVTMPENIQDIFPCDEQVMARYRI